ncbi:hypothetical protein PHYSODRAFT_296877 [Phytophthora sojae]|uniref:Intimal thickness related receptor IRP domain-containing protein n=1 Tax=Phytophthora sojae (strain P6497) TaxID=1094619 RepID=G4YX08_PHYSP|nr:hypothetical protein PHYSODRAFT_296877 [Phytophthora sojae]EGZ25015.1 hypothetical protein PHYSODRAFT_296877 [Phytophthora sojae]|eukprot:XP_009520303.1 hypothetical protein PHYSODRAFT_296877 [Phytophthora sojae]
MVVTQDDINLVSKVLCLPCALLINFGLFQFLFIVFQKRHKEPSIRMLLGVAFISFASLVPGAHPNHELVRDLNDVSDVCSVLSFLLQITVLTRDVNKKFKIPTMVRLARSAQLLVMLSFLVLLLNFVDIASSSFDLETIELLDVVTEYISLVFVVCFRFYFLAMARGPAKVWKSQKLEVFFYVLLATHAVPFTILSHATGLDWHHVQGLWMRCTIVLCLSSTIHARLSSASSKGSQTTSHSKVRRDNSLKPGPSNAQLGPSTKLSSIHPSPPSLWLSARRQLRRL